MDEKKPNPWPQVVKLEDLTRRLEALAGIRPTDDTLILLCRTCQKPYKFCSCGSGVKQNDRPRKV